MNPSTGTCAEILPPHQTSAMRRSDHRRSTLPAWAKNSIPHTFTEILRKAFGIT
jgi:hypothetical protein